MKYLLTIFILLAFTDTLLAQKVPADNRYTVRLSDSGKTIQAGIKPVKMEQLFEDRLYYWFSGGTIHFTQGGYSGKPLDGEFKSFFADKNLKEQGNFLAGLKDGQWKSWNENGTLSGILNWDSGIREGKFSFFDAKGRLAEEGCFHRNLLNGKVRFFGPDSVKTVKYRNGVIVKERQSLIAKKMTWLKKWLHPGKKATVNTSSKQHS